MTVKMVLVATACLSLLAGFGGAFAQNKPASQCSLTSKGAFDLGWVQKQQDEQFRCVATFDPSLRRVGAAWVRVDADGRALAP